MSSMYRVDLLFLQVVLLSVVPYVTSSTCPRNVGERVLECTSIVVPDLGRDADHVKVVRETCKESKLRQVAGCIQGIVDHCKGTTEEEQMIQRLIDKDRLISTVEYFCRYLGVYETHAECIFNHHDEVSECSNEATKSFGTMMSAGANIDVLMMGSCRYHNVARGCLTNTTMSECGQQAGEFVYNLLSGMSPPYCAEAYPGYNSGSLPKHENTQGDNAAQSTVVTRVISLVMPVILVFVTSV